MNKKYIDINQLWKCETCFNHRSGKCNTWCDVGESYRPDISKFKITDVVEVVRCKNCKHYGQYGVCNLHSEYADQYSSGCEVKMDDDDFCSYGQRK